MINKRSFVDWVKGIKGVNKSNNHYIIFDEQGNSKSNHTTQITVRTIDELISNLDMKLSNGIHPNILIHKDRASSYKIDLRHLLINKYINSVSIQGVGHIDFIGGCYKEIKINTPANTEYIFEFDSCNIAVLAVPSCSSLYIKYSSIGVLDGSGHRDNVKNVTLSNCNIFGINVSSDGMCSGDFIIDNATCFPTKTSIESEASLLDNNQVYSNLRKDEQERGNILTSNLFHALEFKTARNHEQWSTKIFNYLYQWVSNYGISISRPLVIFTLLFIFTTALSDNEDAVVLQKKNEFYKGWQKVLLEDKRNITKSTVLSAQSIINLGGIVGTKNLVVAKQDTFTSSWIFFHSLLSLLTLTMFIFALRRRFKIQA